MLLSNAFLILVVLLGTTSALAAEQNNGSCPELLSNQKSLVRQLEHNLKLQAKPLLNKIETAAISIQIDEKIKPSEFLTARAATLLNTSVRNIEAAGLESIVPTLRELELLRRQYSYLDSLKARVPLINDLRSFAEAKKALFEKQADGVAQVLAAFPGLTINDIRKLSFSNGVHSETASVYAKIANSNYENINKMPDLNERLENLSANLAIRRYSEYEMAARIGCLVPGFHRLRLLFEEVGNLQAFVDFEQEQLAR